MIERIKIWWEENFSELDPEPKVKLNHAFEEKEPSKRKLRKRVNTLEAENEILKETIKDELYKTFMAKLGEPQENARLKNENNQLRKKIKTLKEIISEDQYGARRSNSNSRKSSKQTKQRS